MCAWVQPSLSACPGSSLVHVQGGSFGTGGFGASWFWHASVLSPQFETMGPNTVITE